MDREVRKIKQGLGLKFAELVYTGMYVSRLPLVLPPSPPRTQTFFSIQHAFLPSSPTHHCPLQNSKVHMEGYRH